MELASTSKSESSTSYRCIMRRSCSSRRCRNRSAAASMSAAEIRTFLLELVAKERGGDAAAVDADAPFDRLGLDSMALLGIVGDLAERLEMEIDTTLLLEHPTIDRLARHLGNDSTPA